MEETWGPRVVSATSPPPPAAAGTCGSVRRRGLVRAGGGCLVGEQAALVSRLGCEHGSPKRQRHGATVLTRRVTKACPWAWLPLQTRGLCRPQTGGLRHRRMMTVLQGHHVPSYPMPLADRGNGGGKAQGPREQLPGKAQSPVSHRHSHRKQQLCARGGRHGPSSHGGNVPSSCCAGRTRATHSACVPRDLASARGESLVRRSPRLLQGTGSLSMLQSGDGQLGEAAENPRTSGWPHPFAMLSHRESSPGAPLLGWGHCEKASPKLGNVHHAGSFCFFSHLIPPGFCGAVTDVTRCEQGPPRTVNLARPNVTWFEDGLKRRTRCDHG